MSWNPSLIAPLLALVAAHCLGCHTISRSCRRARRPDGRSSECIVCCDKIECQRSLVMSSLPASVPFVGDVQYRCCVPGAASDGSQLWLLPRWMGACIWDVRSGVPACALVPCSSLVSPVRDAAAFVRSLAHRCMVCIRVSERVSPALVHLASAAAGMDSDRMVIDPPSFMRRNTEF